MQISRYKISILAVLLLTAALSGCGKNDNEEVLSSASPVAFASHNAFTANGNVHTWGYNGYGQIGNGTTENTSTPAPVAGLSGMAGSATGGTHTVAFKNLSGAWGWGNNYYGQVGDGSTSARTRPVKVMTAAGPLSGVTAVAAGAHHSLALDENGSIWAWGANYSGQLGDGTNDRSLNAKQVTGYSGVRQIAAGGSHSLALLSDRTVAAWGLNENGQLGDGSTSPSPTPVLVKTAPGTPLTGITAIAAGGGHSLAINGAGEVWAWGNNAVGQLGQGTWDVTARVMSLPKSVYAVKVGNATGAISVAAGLDHSVALVTGGRVLVWGSNFYGQSGNGQVTGSINPVPEPTAVQLKDGTILDGVEEIRSGGEHVLARKGSTLWTWGDNLFGQLGRTTDSSSSGVPGELTLP